MKNKIHVIPHTHWDREWYFTSARSCVYLMKDLKDVLDTLEAKKDFKYFILDGQTSLLSDYLSFVPEDEERIKKLVKDNRLIIGPWYTQSDLMLPSGESIVRNLYYGMEDCEKFGKCMNVGYIPDSFGQSANMPQIYRQFGIEDTVFWRGVSDEMSNKINFNWIGDDGSNVFATQIPNGYYTAFAIPENRDDANEFWNEVCIPSESSRSLTKNVYIANGFDQAPIRRNLPELLKQRNQDDPNNEYLISNIENYIADTKNDIISGRLELSNVKGELLSAKQMRIHKTIYSSRADLKKMNTRIQNYVTHTLEPLMVLSSKLGNDYPTKVIENIWRLLLENAAHDSMGSCISDSPNEDVYMRYKRANDIANSLVELHSRMIATSIRKKEDAYSITLFNTQTEEYVGNIKTSLYIPAEDFAIKDCQGNELNYTILNKKDVSNYVKEQNIQMNPSTKVYMPDKIFYAEIEIGNVRVPAMGYSQLLVELDSSTKQELVNTDILENEYYEITINQNGSLNVFDKVTKHLYKNQAIIKDSGEDGDSFNYSPPRKDLIVKSNDAKADIKIMKNQFYCRAEISYNLRLPYDLNERSLEVCSKDLAVKMLVELNEKDPVIDTELEIDNCVLSHKMCIEFNADLASKFNFADQQFGIIRRPNYYAKEMESYERLLNSEHSDDDKKVVNWDNNPETWQEPMLPIEPTQSFASINNEKRGIAVYPRDVREYEVVGEADDTISLTLFRTYGVMGRENLLYRPGRSSGERTIDTPDAELLKKLKFNLGVYYYEGNINTAKVSKYGYLFNTTVTAFGYGEFLNGRIIFAQDKVEQNHSNNYSLFSKNGQTIVSAIKKQEKGNGLIIRLYNGNYQETVDDQLCFNQLISKAFLVNAKEEIIEEIPVIDNSIKVEKLGHCKFITLLVEF